METLYDLLGALPRDDADGLRAAFRRAVKGAHPDIHPGDPDAGLKFRMIVRASEILADGDQRAAHDYLLDLVDQEQRQLAKRAVARRVRQVASGVIAFSVALGLIAGGYLAITQMPEEWVAPVTELAGVVRQSTEAAAATLRQSTEAAATVVRQSAETVTAAVKPVPLGQPSGDLNDFKSLFPLRNPSVEFLPVAREMAGIPRPNTWARTNGLRATSDPFGP